MYQCGALLETEIWMILKRGKEEGRNKNKKETAIRMLQDGILPIEKMQNIQDL